MKKFLLCLIILGYTSIGYSNSTLPPPNPPARLCDRSLSFSLRGDFIYWKARMEELNMISTASFITDPGNLTSSFVSHEMDFEYSPGFRLGAGVQLPFDGWDIYTFWTHFHTHPSKSFHSSTHNLIDIDQVGAGGIFLATDASVDYNLMLNKIDLQFGRRYSISRTWTVFPSFGICALWLNQDFRHQLNNVETLGNTQAGGLQGFDAFTHSKVKFWGVGPSCAFEGEWNLGWGFGIIGKIGATLACGEHSTRTHSVENELQENENGPPSVGIHYNNVRGKGERIRPVVQMFLGLSYEKCFIPGSLAGKVNLGYESLYFMEQILQIHGLGASDLSLSGLTLSASLNF